MSEAVERLWRRVLHLVASARVLIVRDAGPAQLIQASLNAATLCDDVPRLAEYGFTSAPPAGADAIAVAVAGDSSGMVIIATNHQTYRLRGLGDGEVAVHDDKGQSIELRASGIVINGAALPMTIRTTGGLSIEADTTFTGTVYANGKRIDDQHHHVPDSHGDTQGVVA